MNPNRREWIAVATLAVVGAARRANAQPAGATTTLGTLLTGIETARATVTTLDAEFTQERVMGLFAQALRAQGTLAVQRPDKVRWEVVSPDRAVFIVNAGRISMRAGTSNASASQRQVGPLGSILGDLATFLGGSIRTLQARYTLSVGSTVTTLVAVPTEATLLRVLRKLELRFSPDLRGIDFVSMQEAGGDTTRITLRNVRVNSGRVNAETFRI